MSITEIDATVLADMGEDFPATFAAADPTTQRALIGYLNTYAGPWGLKASEEDAVLGIVGALWPEWVAGERSGAIYKLRADERLGRIADAMFEDCGETPIPELVARVVADLRPIIAAAS